MTDLHIHSNLFYVKRKNDCSLHEKHLFAAINEGHETFCFFKQDSFYEQNAEDLWSCLMIRNILDFDTPGILNEVLTPIADIGVSVLVISGFSTDYIFFKHKNINMVKKTLTEKGHVLHG